MDEFVVEPEGWLSRGQAFLRGQGVQMVVAGGIPGETAYVRVTGRTQHQVFAKFITPKGPAHPHRVEPVCDRYHPCGRCPWMHLSSEGQGEAHRKQLASALADAALPAISIEGPHSDMSMGLHTIELIAGFSDEHHVRIGVAGMDRAVVAIPKCHVVTPQIREFMKVVAHHVRTLDIRPWDGSSGTLKRIRVIQAPGSNELMITLITARKNHFLTELASNVGAAMPEVASIYTFNEQADPPDTPFLLYGREVIEGSLNLPLPTRLRCGPTDPFPGHPLLAARAAQDAIALFSPAKGDAIIDLGAGIGLRTLALARKTGWALGIDPSLSAVQRARDNAALNQISAEFQQGTIQEALENPRLNGLRPLVCIDTERRGLETADMEALIGASPRKILLSSSNPRALARDCAMIVRQGFELSRVIAYDVAPYTPFAENTALLVSTNQQGPTRRAPRRKAIR